MVLNVAGAADWPMHRGRPDLNGVAAGELAARPELLWTFKTGGPIKASAVIAGNRVFIGSEDKQFYALDFETGKRLWSVTNREAIESTALVLQDTVYVGASDGKLGALDVASGVARWEFATEDKILGGINWFVHAGRTNLLVGSYDYRLYCLDAVTGRSNWVFETGNYINGTPAVADGLTALGGCDGVLYSLALSNGTLVASNEIGAPIAASVALADGSAFFGHYENQFLAVDLRAGTNRWAYRDRPFPYFSSPAITSERVVFGGRDKKLHCVNRADGKPVWTFATRGKVDSSPVICGDKVVVGSDDGRLYLVALAGGQELWSHEVGAALEASPAVARGKIVVGSDDGSVYCFGNK
jgi:outer membrane protein assembly factor BamB